MHGLLAGPMRCLECGFEVVSVRPAATWGKGCECPECGEVAMYSTEDMEDDGMPVSALENPDQ